MRRFLLLAVCVPTAALAQSGLSLSDALDAAARQSPAVAVAAQQVAAEQAGLQAAASAFDPQVYGSVGGSQALTPLQQSTGLTTAGQGYQQYQIGVRRRFRSGLEITPLVQMGRTALEGAATRVETTAGVSAAYPLFGGRARSSAVAGEDAAARRVSAAVQDRSRAVEMAASEAAYAYWSYVGALRIRRARAEAEARVERLLQETDALVRASERPAADLIPLQADLARLQADRLGADQGVYDARLQLGLAMGGSAEDADALGDPLDDLPEVPAPLTLNESALVEYALGTRADLRAATLWLSALEREAAAGRADLRPSVDLVLDAGYTALNDGASGPHQYVPLGLASARGGRFGLTLRMNRLGSEAARATASRQAAAVAGARITRDDLARRIRADIAGAVAALRSSAAEVAQTRTTVGLYELALDNERRRLRHGMGTLFDVRAVEERLAGAQTAVVQAEVRYAQALVSLHTAAGTLRAPEPPALLPPLW